MNIDLRRASEDDLQGVLSLLAESGLPQDGLSDHLATTLVATDNGHIVGSAALEVYPDGALLRSVAVAPRLRGSGLAPGPALRGCSAPAPSGPGPLVVPKMARARRSAASAWPYLACSR